MRPLHDLGGMGLIRAPGSASRTGALLLEEAPPDRRRLHGRLAAMFFAGSGVLGLATLDLGLPDLDGLEVLASMRERGSTVPVLVLSARGRVDDRVKGLNLGAGDYLGKPFAFEELLARVRANLRPRTAVSPDVVHVGGICIDLLRREATVDGRTVSFSYLRRKLGEPIIETVRGVGYRLQI